MVLRRVTHQPIITHPPFLVKRLARERDLNYNPVLPRRVTAKFKAGNNPHNRQDSPHITAARWLTASPAVEFLNFLTTLVKRLAWASKKVKTYCSKRLLKGKRYRLHLTITVTNHLSIYHQYLHKPHLLVRYRASGIQKNAQHIFLKVAKAAALRVRSPPAEEANAVK